MIQEFVAGMDKDQFKADLKTQSAVVRQLEIIGEATKRLSDESRQNHPSIPWRQMAGMRDILIHAYDHIDMEEVWNAAQISIPDLIKQVKKLLAEI